MSDLSSPIGSVCVFCGSSNAVDRKLLEAASAFGRALARDGVRMVYGGGGVGLMGACARAAHGAGGRVLGVMPDFLRQNEVLYDDVDTIVVRSMHERKSLMFEQSDAFAILPGGIGTLEEVVELMSWRRLGLHHKPIVFYSPGGFWQPLFGLFQHTVDQKLTPPAFMDVWRSVDDVEAILPTMRELAADAERETGALPRLM
ncbi:MAG TPA: TIGR00730 family Rossman fold protein [Caulobacteraceae bacterium]|jgi:hypothetical protein|nr:TIGR00730 family Rossman fold protein [Caulobacteraceae bacterium]